MNRSKPPSIRFFHRIAVWLSAARLRTLPLALSTIIMGAGLAASEKPLHYGVLSLALLTALLLQVLSNFANDLGDTLTGADNGNRVGPLRTVQSGKLTPKAMHRAIIITILLIIISGCSLLWLAFAGKIEALLTFIALGGCAILAALGYTLGKRPYGYLGLGDFAVLLFFGLLGVLGSYYLFNQQLSLWLLLPALSCGALSMAVLNINNIRDAHNDQLSGKITLAVRLGETGARRYHLGLILTATLFAVLYLAFNRPATLGWLALLALWHLGMTTRTVMRSTDPVKLDGCLKRTAIGSLLFNALFAAGLQISL